MTDLKIDTDKKDQEKNKDIILAVHFSLLRLLLSPPFEEVDTSFLVTSLSSGSSSSSSSSSIPIFSSLTSSHSLIPTVYTVLHNSVLNQCISSLLRPDVSVTPARVL